MDDGGGNAAPTDDLAADLETSFAAWASSYVLGELQALPGLFWLGWPVSGALASQMVVQVVSILTKSVVVRSMLALQAEQKAPKAEAYLAARLAKRRLKGAPREDLQRAETAEMVSFVDLVRLGRS